MRIVIDCRMYGLEHAGIGRYVANLVREIKNLAKGPLRSEASEARQRRQKPKNKNLEMILLVRSKNFREIEKEIRGSFKVVVCDIPHYSLREQILLPLQLIKLRPDLVHFPHFNVPFFYFGKYVVTIHDLIKHESRGKETTTKTPLLYWLKYCGYRLVFWNAVGRASKILVPSEWVKKELVKECHLGPGKIVVTYEGASKKIQNPNSKFSRGAGSCSAGQIPNKILKKYQIKKPFIVYTGSLYPHKNVERLIQSIKLLSNNYKRPISLVIICARSVFWKRILEKIKKMGAENLVNLAGFVPDEEVGVLYQEAVALVQPSLMEGFDLSAVEAMTAGLPVIVSDIPVHREICGQAALYFDPYNPADMADKIKFIVGNEEERERLRTLGFGKVKKYSWQKMAEQTLKVYRSLIHNEVGKTLLGFERNIRAINE